MHRRSHANRSSRPAVVSPIMGAPQKVEVTIVIIKTRESLGLCGVFRQRLHGGVQISGYTRMNTVRLRFQYSHHRNKEFDTSYQDNR